MLTMANCGTTPVKFLLRRDTTAGWASTGAILAVGEPGVNVDSGQMKIGDGVHTWNSLPFMGSTGPTGTTGPQGPIAVGTNAASSYGFSSNIVLSPGVQTVFRYDQTYVEYGTYLSGSPHTRLTVVDGGIYELITSIQFGNSGGTDALVLTWIRVNGVQVDSTNGAFAVPANTNLASLISVPYLLTMSAGQYIEVIAYTGSDGVTAVGFNANTESSSSPAGPSIAVNLKKVAVDIGKTGPTGQTGYQGVDGKTGPTGYTG